MSRRILLTAAFWALWAGNPIWAAPSELISETSAAQHGLTRPWFAQVQLDRSRARICDLFLHDGALYASTNAATVHAIDAETGQTLWSKQVGDPKQPTMRPGVSRDLIAVVNGSHLYVLNRFNGELLFDKILNGAAGAGPAMSEQWVYVPMSHGLMTAYRMAPPPKAAASKNDPPAAMEPPSEEERRRNLSLSQATQVALVCQSYGQTLVQPMVTRESEDEEFVLWPTDRGFLNLARIDRKSEAALRLKFRMGADSPIVGRPAYLPRDPSVTGDTGMIVAAASNGFVYAIQDKNGDRMWRFSTGEPVVEAVVAIEHRIYVSTQFGGMYCLSVKKGEELWYAPHALRFLAASKARVYAADSLGRVLVLNAENGAQLDSIDVGNTPIKLINDETDRIYLASETGIIQCLHEVEQSEVIKHNKDRNAGRIEERQVKPKAAGNGKKPAETEQPDAPAEEAAPNQ